MSYKMYHNLSKLLEEPRVEIHKINFLMRNLKFFITLGLKILILLGLKEVFETDILNVSVNYNENHKVPNFYE